jgi:hypothetical protein
MRLRLAVQSYIGHKDDVAPIFNYCINFFCSFVVFCRDVKRLAILGAKFKFRNFFPIFPYGNFFSREWQLAKQ